ncbi:energy transducer TonB family protein [Rhizobium tumorigenes]|uniref:energy transducer TonB family protein n=1 Tax=Rhizobium tumorigenes TaxID=2041385 RepID=UPI00241E2EFB|nr:TonB family protein [Rhizobium tumorigenes]WFR99797.1 TonB family protein [Rhizobium tumorigenes]
MTSPAKSRSRPFAGIDPRMGAVVNDNTPPTFPAHELLGLDELPRPPAAEAVVHYARLTRIASYPAHPDAAAEAGTAAPPIDPLPDVPRSVRAGTRTASLAASLCSLLFHVAVFSALMTAVVTLPEDPVEDAGDSVSVVMLGNGDADQQASGEENKEPPKPDEIVAEAVQPSKTETAEVTPVEPQQTEPAPAVQPSEPVPEAIQPDPVQPTQALSQVSPETVVSQEPEVLAAQVPAEPTVVQPQASEVPLEETKPPAAPPSDAATTPVPPVPASPAEIIPPEETVKPIEKPTPPPKVQKPKEVVKKPPPKAAKLKSGSKGENEQDSKRGSSEGTETARSDSNSAAVGNRQGSGSAAVANYPGKVQSRIRRSVRPPSQYRRMTAPLTVRVQLTVGASGELTSLSVARSSGVPEIDNVALDGVRRAAPFPSLPPEWGKPSWTFTQEVQVTGN